MDEGALYDATVPVLRHYLGRLDGLVAQATADQLQARLHPGMFTAARQFRTAQLFMLRSVFPVIGQTAPQLAEQGDSGPALLARSTEIAGHLGALTVADFAGAPGRIIAHRAGMADLKQPAADYVTRFALPNVFFHLSMGYATLRAEGAAIGKADFDGLHFYPEGFSF
jgi:hypothetical protein